MKMNKNVFFAYKKYRDLQISHFSKDLINGVTKYKGTNKLTPNDFSGYNTPTSRVYR